MVIRAANFRVASLFVIGGLLLPACETTRIENAAPGSPDADGKA
jgi:hypothetical protein